MGRRDELVLKALEGRLAPAERRELARLDGDDPALRDLLEQDDPGAALAERIADDAALSPRGAGRRLQRLGIALAVTGLLAPVLVLLGLPLFASWGLLGLGSALALGPELVARMRRRDPYDIIEQ